MVDSQIPPRLPAQKVSDINSLNINALALIEPDHARIAMLFAELDRLTSQGNAAAKVGGAARIFHPTACEAPEHSNAMRWVLSHRASVRHLIEKLEPESGEDDSYDTRIMALNECAIRDVELEEIAFSPQVKAAGMSSALASVSV